VILYVLVCIFLILVVLLQQGKGADLAGAFGGGGSQTSFGPRTTTNIMHRLTTASFVLFVVLSLTLAILSGKRHASVMESVTAQPPPISSEAPSEPAMAPVGELEEQAVETEAAIDEETPDTPTDEPPTDQ
jgi:preprotein translocase subunit SecG